MKIGITCYPTYGGSGVVATELGVALARLGHEIHFVTYKQPFRLPPFTPRVYFHEVDVGRYPLFEYPPYDLALAVRMHEVVQTHGLDLLHCHYAIPHATSAWIAREMLERTGGYVPVVTTLHGTDITIVGQDPSYHAITKFSIEKSDGLTAVSRYLQQETLSTFGCTACRIEVIPNFIDPEVYNRTKYTSVFDEQVGRDTRVLMHISNFRPVKRIPDVLQVFARVSKRVPSVLVMVGDGPERVDAEQLARDLGVDDKVFFLGKIDTVAPLLAGADLFLIPSDRESFGLGALEALASGVPVIGANVGGLPEVVRSGETGYLGAVADVEGMADAAIDLLLDDAKWSRASAYAIEDARARFSQAEIVRQYEDFYRYAMEITARKLARRDSVEKSLINT
ncbi:MAG TPA: N-acetyl-alpha-D-glucosaminyl L-malate synthase BshA [Gemmatimonadaceae bacterium]|nr:N-acetyl-alpha-D-glucosaminyl L-malate synthase BshA [Gemmatimonadaceae bacterium]